MSTGRWREKGVPHHGWNEDSVEDLGDTRMYCEMCESALIRHVHVMVHAGYPVSIRAGSICAEAMETGYRPPRRQKDPGFENPLKKTEQLG